MCVLCSVVLCCVVLCCVSCVMCGVWSVRAGRGKKRNRRRGEEEERLDARCSENKKSVYVPEEYAY